MKTCSHCGVEKYINDFCKNKGVFTQPCRVCHRKEVRQYAKDNPGWEKARMYNKHLKKNYGITLSEFNDRAEKQKNLCAICQKPEPMGTRLSVDHSHDGTNKVRDLLCRKCNSALGFLDDDILRVQAALDYLKRHAGTV